MTIMNDAYHGEQQQAGEVPENPRAFPHAGNSVWGISPDTGMSLRDWFAGQAMAAIIAKIPFEEYPADFSPYEKTAIGAYDYADAMLLARTKGGDA